MMLKKPVLVMILAATVLLALGYSGHAEVYGDKRSKIYHAQGCPEIAKIDKPYLQVFGSEPEAEAHGYYPCHQCLPPLVQSMQHLEGRQKHALPIAKIREFIGDRKNKVVHQPWCPQVKKLSAADKVVFKDIDKAWADHYTPCPECHPPVKPEKLKTGKDSTPKSDKSIELEPELGTD